MTRFVEFTDIQTGQKVFANIDHIIRLTEALIEAEQDMGTAAPTAEPTRHLYIFMTDFDGNRTGRYVITDPEEIEQVKLRIIAS